MSIRLISLSSYACMLLVFNDRCQSSLSPCPLVAVLPSVTVVQHHRQLLQSVPSHLASCACRCCPASSCCCCAAAASPVDSYVFPPCPQGMQPSVNVSDPVFAAVTVPCSMYRTLLDAVFAQFACRGSFRVTAESTEGDSKAFQHVLDELNQWNEKDPRVRQKQGSSYFLSVDSGLDMMLTVR
jgi:hypothetical protein